ncbi:hypothetical protein JHK82_027761 [Glycine max]|nr:hypothetical protein JHK82_027761 [Glycine max]
MAGLSQTLPHKPPILSGLPFATVKTPYSKSRKATVRPWSRFGCVYWDIHRRLPLLALLFSLNGLRCFPCDRHCL